MDGYSLHGDSYRAGFSAAPAPASAPPLPPPPPPPGAAPAPAAAPFPSPAYYGAYPPPSYGYLPPTADRWSSFPLPAGDLPPHLSYPSAPLDRNLAYGHLPFQPEPLPHPYSYPGPPQNFRPPPQTFMPPPHRGGDAGRFRKKKPFSQHNLRPNNKPFKQTQQAFKAGGKAVQQKTAPEGKKAGKVEPKAAKATSQGDPLANDVQQLHSLWRIGGDEAPGGIAGKKRKAERQDKGEGKPAQKDEGKIIQMGEKRVHTGRKKSRRKKNRKQAKDKRSRGRNDDANGNATAEKVEKRRKVEAAPMTEEEMQEAKASVELQRAARKSVHEFLHVPLEKEDAQKTGSQDAQKAGSGDADEQMVESGDAQQSQGKDALESEKNNAQELVNGGAQEPVNDDELKTETDEQKPLIDNARSFEKKQNQNQNQNQNQETLTPEELKVREEKGFEFFSKLLEENNELRKLYVEKCNKGVFECLVCHSKMNKKFSNLVSLVTHASNVLKTKKLPEHRGYGRAVCALLGWDPFRIPKVPRGRGKGSRSGGESAPEDTESAPRDNANNSTTKQEVSKDVKKFEGEGGSLEASNKDAEGGDEQAEEANATDNAGDMQTDGDAIQDSAA